jgi:RNA polymerase sigma-70 factor (ECF subfamily)
MDSLHDNELASRLARGEDEALGLLYDRYGALANGVALRLLHDAHAAEDVVQEAFLQIWRRAGSFDARRGTLRSWLLSIVHNRAIDLHRRRAARPNVSSHYEELELPDASDTWTEVRLRLRRETLARALACLSAEQRTVIELAFFGGYTHTEIADRLGLPLGTVKGRARLGLQRLRGLLGSPDAEQLTVAAG